MSLTAFLPGIFEVIKKIIPDKEAQQKAQIQLLELQQAGEFRELDKAFESIHLEAQSSDKWTSRARPTFLYAMYIMILLSIPMGVLYAFRPETAALVALGMREWLAAIPEPLWWLFGAGYTGYSTARSFDKLTFAKAGK